MEMQSGSKSNAKRPAIKVVGIHKSFRLPHEKNASIKSVIINPLRRRGYENQQVLHGISFEVHEGDFFGIVGRNGSGKSTLLKLLAGIYSPDQGRIELSGRLTPFIELGVGFNPELTGRENVFLNGALLGFGRTAMEKLYDDIVAFAELERFMDQKLKNYSSGMQVRLAFSIATRISSPILLLDEVLAVGDVAFQRKCYNYFKDLKRQGKTVVLVTHDMDVVREFCDKGVLISNGRIAFEGTSQDLAREYAKLFDHEDQPTVVEGARWGDKKVLYSDVTLKKQGDEYVLRVSLTAATSVAAPVLGFVIKNAEGKPVLGTNSAIKGHKLADLKPSETRSMTWRFPDIFSNGLHTVDVAITQKDGATVHDWWEGATTFTTTGKDKNPYIVSPHIELDIK